MEEEPFFFFQNGSLVGEQNVTLAYQAGWRSGLFLTPLGWKGYRKQVGDGLQPDNVQRTCQR